MRRKLLIGLLVTIGLVGIALTANEYGALARALHGRAPAITFWSRAGLGLPAGLALFVFVAMEAVPEPRKGARDWQAIGFATGVGLLILAAPISLLLGAAAHGALRAGGYAACTPARPDRPAREHWVRPGAAGPDCIATG